MKLIKYQLMTEVNLGTEEEPNIVQTFNPCEIRCKDEVFEANLAIAEAEAYGKVTVEEVPDEETSPTLEARVGVLEESNAELNEALTMILEGVTE